jgi:hypothetical protein
MPLGKVAPRGIDRALERVRRVVDPRVEDDDLDPSHHSGRASVAVSIAYRRVIGR